MFTDQEYQSILHEIKNSVTLIGSSLQLIEKKHPEVIHFPFWNTTMEDIRRLQSLFREISSSRQWEDLHPTRISASDFLQDMEQDLPNILPEYTHCSFTYTMDLPLLFIDTLRMRHAFLNLIKNASEAITQGGQIQISAEATDSHVRITLSDNGCGICPESLSDIFTPQFTTKEEGTGLGLCITKKIIEAHQGTISCESQVGIGTTFTISLPIAALEHPLPSEDEQLV